MEKDNNLDINETIQRERNYERKNEKIFDIRERTFQFSQRIMEIAEMIPFDNIGKNFQNQLIISGTSVGANMEEADGSITRPDFINKVAMARKVAKETRYWLRLIGNKYKSLGNLQDEIKESEEIIRILSTIINNTKQNNKKIASQKDEY